MFALTNPLLKIKADTENLRIGFLLYSFLVLCWAVDHKNVYAAVRILLESRPVKADLSGKEALLGAVTMIGAKDASVVKALEGMVSRSDYVLGPVKNGVVLVLYKGTPGRLGNGIADRVVLASRVVRRVGQVVKSVVLENEGTLRNTAVDRLPRLFCRDEELFGALVDRKEILGHLRNVDLIAVIYANVVEIDLPVIVDEDVSVDTSSFAEPALVLLLEGAERTVRYCDSHVLLGGICHVEFAVLDGDLGCPEPFVAHNVGIFEGESLAFPVYEIVGDVNHDPVDHFVSAGEIKVVLFGILIALGGGVDVVFTLVMEDKGICAREKRIFHIVVLSSEI